MSETNALEQDNQERGIEARFTGGPWAGRTDIRVRPGTRTVNVMVGRHYVYGGYKRLVAGGVFWVQYEWPNSL